LPAPCSYRTVGRAAGQAVRPWRDPIRSGTTPDFYRRAFTSIWPRIPGDISISLCILGRRRKTAARRISGVAGKAVSHMVDHASGSVAASDRVDGRSAAESLKVQDPAKIAALALASLRRILKRTIPVPDAFYFHNWREDPFSRGAYSYAPVGAVPARKVFATPDADTLIQRAAGK
jgi:hypothetical protein